MFDLLFKQYTTEASPSNDEIEVGMGSEHRPTGINPGSAPKQNPSEEKSKGKSQQGKADKGKGNGNKGDKGGKPEKQDSKPAVKQTTKASTKPPRRNW